MNRPRPEIGDRRRAVRVLGIELGQFLLGFALDPLAPFADFVGEALAVFRDVFENDFVEQHGDWIEVAGEGVRAHAQGFERDGAAAGKRIHDERAGAGRAAERLVRRLRERAARFQVFRHRGVVPIGEVGDEVEQRAAELFRIIEQRGLLPSLLEPLSAFLAEQTSAVRAMSKRAFRRGPCRES